MHQRLFSGREIAVKNYLDAWSKADNESVYLFCSDKHPKDITYYEGEMCISFKCRSRQIHHSHIKEYLRFHDKQVRKSITINRQNY